MPALTPGWELGDPKQFRDGNCGHNGNGVTQRESRKKRKWGMRDLEGWNGAEEKEQKGREEKSRKFSVELRSHERRLFQRERE